MVLAYIKALYNNKLTDSLEYQLWKAVYDILAEGITEGVKAGPKIEAKTEADLVAQLKSNTAVFSAFKNHSFKKELVKLLVNEEGDVRAWKEFRAEAVKLNDEYNKRWLKTEYDLAVDSANKAAQWKDFQKRAHLYPNLKYKAINDERTRELHRKWDGVVLPINHKFWETHYPPNDWGCRCTVIQTDEDVDAKKNTVNDMPNLPKQFNNNVGKTTEVFTKDHPYFKDASKTESKKVNKSLEKWKKK